MRDLGRDRSAIVSFTIRGMDAAAVNSRLFKAGINVSHSTPASTLLDSTARGLPTVLRASPHYYNTSEEIDRLISELRSLR